MTEKKERICPVEQANSLDSNLRRWLQNPNKILSPYAKEGMKVLDVGCGPGFFSIELAKICLLYTSPSPRDRTRSRMPSSA